MAGDGVTMSTETLEDRARVALAAVPDPEIPTCSIVDLGMVERVEATGDALEVDLLPTFVGCPAKDIIAEDVDEALRAVAGGREVRVRFVYDPPWTTGRITPKGKEGLRELGISPHREASPGNPGTMVVPLMQPARISCPYCGSEETVMEAAFGPTPCRTTHFCRSCRNPFEGFKEKRRQPAGSASSPSTTR
jgi:ring-1,2-phenylacetyl-CoA epoxidase subunit PaaD